MPRRCREGVPGLDVALEEAPAEDTPIRCRRRAAPDRIAARTGVGAPRSRVQRAAPVKATAHPARYSGEPSPPPRCRAVARSRAAGEARRASATAAGESSARALRHEPAPGLGGQLTRLGVAPQASRTSARSSCPRELKPLLPQTARRDARWPAEHLPSLATPNITDDRAPRWRDVSARSDRVRAAPRELVTRGGAGQSGAGRRKE